MLKNKILEKLLAIILIFTLTSVNFAFVTEAYAASITEVIFGDKSDTGSKNVGFDAYFETEDGNNTSVISDVNNEDLAVSMNLSVENSGYLKDAEISIKEAEEGKGLNFILKELEELPEEVQSIEDNVLRLKQINSSDESISLELPIEYKNEKYFDESNLSKDFLVVLKGTYVNNKADEKEISKEVVLTLSWKDERELNVETEVEKYVDYGEGVIVQSKVTVDNYTEENTLPVKETEITIDVPKYADSYPSNVYVVANYTKATNGDEVGEVEFSEDNWEYNEEEGKLTIKVENEKQTVVVNEYEDEFLQEADKELVEEERYYNLPGSDEYIVTYTYDDVEDSEEMVSIDSNVEAKMTFFSGAEEDNNENIITNEDNYIDELKDKVGNLVSLNIENKTESISKAYLYSNLESERYDVEIESKTIINIADKDIVKGLEIKDDKNLYIDENEKEYENPDLYYKEVSVSKDNLVELLGEEGEIVIYDLSGNKVTTISAADQADDEGNIVYSFESEYSRLNFKTSSPTGKGNLIISSKKVMRTVSVSKEVVKTLKYVSTVASIEVESDYISEDIDLKTAEGKVELLNTETKATLSMNRENLSTITENEGVELRIALNNATESSDLYGHSEFEIELPESIESVNITESSILYGDELSITSATVEDRAIKVVLDGKQTEVRTNGIENGTFVIIEADIKVNMFTPSKEETMKLTFKNNESTNVYNNGEDEITVVYSAPTGLVTVNSTYNYNEKGGRVSSVRQGMQNDLIDVYSSSKVATMELVVMNNSKNNVSDFSILGRFPFEGAKLILDDISLNNTLTPEIVRAIEADENNDVDFDIYYSENENASKDLNNDENGWKKLGEDGMDIKNAKSYLLVPSDENYIMDQYTTLRFTYDYKIPENLPHNENIYGTFVAYYTYMEGSSITRDQSEADLVGLTTGVGPEVSLELSTSDNKVKELEELQVVFKIKNVGKEKAREVNVDFEIPEHADYVSYINEEDILDVKYENNKVTIYAEEMEVEKEVIVTVLVKAEKIPSDAEEEVYIEPRATISAKDLGVELEAKADKVLIEEAEFEIKETEKIGSNSVEMYVEGDEVRYTVTVTNITDTTLTNVVATKQLPEVFVLTNAYSILNSTKSEAQYDESNRTITWKINELPAGSMVILKAFVKVGHISDEFTGDEVSTYTTVSADGTDKYNSNVITIKIGRPELKITQVTDNVNTYIKEGSTVTYTFTIENIGTAKADNVLLREIIPDGLKIKEIEYGVDGSVSKKSVSSSKDAMVRTLMVQPESELVINVKAIAAGLNGAQEKTVTNYAYVSADGINEIKTDEITHIIEASDILSQDDSNLQKSKSTTRTSSLSNISKTYKVTGTAWLDKNKDGIRTAEEELLTGISAKLVNSETGVILKTITTDATGAYAFTGVENGNYFVIFDYDTVKYGVTTYQKAGAATNVNSDVVSTKVEQDGKTRNAAITDVIRVTNGSVSGIDIGLVLADVFDLKIDKSITKVTVQTVNGSNTDNYDNTKLAKTEIAAKYLSGATVYVEYEITVTNVGDIAGYAKKIVDYIPNGMTFSSSVKNNASWYTGVNNDLYNEELANRELKKGESATVKLVLTRSMTADNTDIVNNMAEIYEDYNIYGVSDQNSTPANKAQGENDLSSADIAIMVKTGETFLNISVVMMTLLLIVIVGFVVYGKVVEIVRRKEGV